MTLEFFWKELQCANLWIRHNPYGPISLEWGNKFRCLRIIVEGEELISSSVYDVYVLWCRENCFRHYCRTTFLNKFKTLTSYRKVGANNYFSLVADNDVEMT